MKWKLKDLSTDKLKNRVLCQLEDAMLDGILDNMAGGENADSAMAIDVAKAIKTNAKEIAMICYTDESGEPLEDADFEGVPYKIKVFQECAPHIMTILSEMMGGSQDEGKRKRVTTTKRNS